MFGKRNHKDDAVRIDADWLLGKPIHRSVHTFPWFGRISISLVCILLIVWSWPHASRLWLNWELHRQLAGTMDHGPEDVLPIMLAMHDLDPSNTQEWVEQLASADVHKRSTAQHLLEQKIKHWNQSPKIPASEIAALIDLLNSDRVASKDAQSKDVMLLRAQLASQLRPLITSDLPDATRLIASIESMLIQGDPASQLRSGADQTKPISSTIPVIATKTRISDSGTVSDRTGTVSDRTVQFSNTGYAQSPPPGLARTDVSGPVLTSMRTLTDQASTTSTSTHSNPSLSIPRTVPSAVIRLSDAVAQPMEEPPPVVVNQAHQQEPSSISGIEKLEMERLLPLLNSSQTRIERQAFNELVRRNVPQANIELAIVMAQGATEEKLKAMESIARDTMIDAIPWLDWMAGNADPIVRRRAIALLGSMSNPDAMRRLRVLQSREPDHAISDQINQVLLASGTASKSVR
jgi:hypothetical protein